MVIKRRAGLSRGRVPGRTEPVPAEWSEPAQGQSSRLRAGLPEQNQTRPGNHQIYQNRPYFQAIQLRAPAQNALNKPVRAWFFGHPGQFRHSKHRTRPGKPQDRPALDGLISGLFLLCYQSILDIQDDSVECQILDRLVGLLDFWTACRTAGWSDNLSPSAGMPGLPAGHPSAEP